MGLRRIWRNFRARRSEKNDQPHVQTRALEPQVNLAYQKLAKIVATQGHDVSAVSASLGASVAQFRQDIFCLLFANAKRNGFFVEFGACDGVEISNTVLLERQFGWTGILAEPGRHWHDRLRRNRTSVLDTRCVWKASGQTLKFNQTTFDDRAAISDFHVAAAGEVVSTYDVETVSLNDLLSQHDAPRNIDFLSVDVEGAETAILDAFPFDTYKFGFICVEQHGEGEKAAVGAILNRSGYRQVLPEISGYDGWYVPADQARRLGLA
jgi:FkbM family methyltransferase